MTRAFLLQMRYHFVSKQHVKMSLCLSNIVKTYGKPMYTVHL